MHVWLFAGVLIVTATPASADTTWDVLKRFGYIGTWAGECNRPATRLNFFETVFKDDLGNAKRAVDRGASIPIAMGFFDHAQIVSRTMIKLRIRNADRNWGALDGFSYEAVFIKDASLEGEEVDRIRGIESVRSDGKVIAKNGFVALYGNKPAAWVYRCRPVS